MTSTEKSTLSFSSVAADANALLSASSGGNASLIFEPTFGIHVVTTRHNWEEAREHAPEAARNTHTSLEKLYRALGNLRVEIVEGDEYLPGLARASQVMRDRDSDDAHLLALALVRKIPIWSNDPHFDGLKIVKVLKTGQLLKILGL